MCGFFFSTRKSEIENENSTKTIQKLLWTRGPDDQVSISSNVGKFIFARLSIIDVNKRSSQPMSINDKELTIMNNGEIYNYIELKENYLKDESFDSDGDTEVFIRLWKKYGINSLEKLRGMFAYLIYDRSEEKIYFGRDPLGIKPLFYVQKGNDLLLSSETKILREVGFNKFEKNNLQEVLMFGSSGDSRTGINSIKRCIPGITYIFDLKRRKLTRNNLNIQSNKKFKLNKKDPEQILDYLEKEIKKSIKLHLRSDVGYSIQLSGGVDSSLITAMATMETKSRQKTFGLDIADSHQNEKWARELVVKKYNCDHTEVQINSRIYAEYFEKSIKALDSPIIHSGTPPLLKLYEHMKEYSKVAISGEGADEAFMGYSRYREANRYRKIGLLSKYFPEFFIKLTKYQEALRFTKSRDPLFFMSIYGDTTTIMEIFPSIFKNQKFINPRSINNNLFSMHKKINFYDKKYYLQTLLHRQDLISMASSVECRTPFADSKIFSITEYIPTNLKVDKFETKKLLKKIAEKYLDKKIIYRKKIGLNIPLDKWLRKEEIFIAKLEFLKSKNSCLSQYADQNILLKYVDGFLEKKYTLKDVDLFKLLCIEEWLHLLK